MISCGVGTPSCVFASAPLPSYLMMSIQSSTHSSQMKTVGPAINLRTSCCDLPQNEQYSVFLLSPPVVLLIFYVPFSHFLVLALRLAKLMPNVVVFYSSVKPNINLLRSRLHHDKKSKKPDLISCLFRHHPVLYKHDQQFQNLWLHQLS